MTIEPNDVSRLRRYIAEPTAATYTDEELTLLIKESALMDVDGKEPSDPNWNPTYDVFKVASDIWLEKASAVADEFDFDSDGGRFNRSQKVEAYTKQSSYYRSRSKASSLQTKQRPIEKLSTSGWEDMPYKDEIDEYEENLK